MRDVGVFKYIISIVVVLLCITVAYGGDRRNIKTYDTGDKGPHGNTIVEHFTLLDPGECNDNGCLLYEKEITGWDGINWLHQFIDRTGNGVCDVIIVWKPLIDPTHGTFYTLFYTKTCGGAV